MSCSPRQHTRLPCFISLILICVAAVPIAQAQVQQASCTFKLFLLDRSSPSNPDFDGGTGVNDRKTVVGEANFYYTQTPPFSKGFVHYFGGGTVYYSAPGAIRTRFNARNNNGVTVGIYTDSSAATHSFILQGGTLTNIAHPNAAPNTTMVQGINKFNTTVGSFSSIPWGGTVRAFKRDSSGKFSSFSFPGSQTTQANGINDNGVIVGSYVEPGSVNGGLVWRGFAYHNGQWVTVDYPGNNVDTFLLGISNTGVIIGMVFPVGPPIYFMYANGVFKKIDVPNSSATQVSGISAGGVITGTTDFNQGFTATCQ